MGQGFEDICPDLEPCALPGSYFHIWHNNQLMDICQEEEQAEGEWAWDLLCSHQLQVNKPNGGETRLI